MWILAYLCSSLDPRLGGHFSPIWSPSKSLLKYDTFSLWNLQFLAPEAPPVISLNLGCPNPCPDIVPGFHLSLQAWIWACRLQSQPPGLNLSLQAWIWGSRLQSEPGGFNLSSRLQSEPGCFNLSPQLSIWAFSPMWAPSQSLLKYDTFSLWHLLILDQGLPAHFSQSGFPPNSC